MDRRTLARAGRTASTSAAPPPTIIDLGDKIASRLPIFFLAVIGLGFLILMAVFRSVVVPLTAALMNLLSIGAAFGILVAVFQWGWLGGLIGVGKTGPIECLPADDALRHPLRPLHGLRGLPGQPHPGGASARLRQRRGRRRGLSLSMRLITAAAAIMCSVFLSFAFGDQRVIKEFGIGLASAIFIDAAVIRLFLVPS